MSRNNKVTPIAEQWGKVARWAGIGNNENEGDETMTEETMVQAVDETDAVQAGAVEESGDAGAAR